MTLKITQAAAATNSAEDKVIYAIDVLRNGLDGVVTNGYGVYVRPDMRRADLRVAKEAVDTALGIIDAATWPTEADYLQT
jgi:hypothetical protein